MSLLTRRAMMFNKEIIPPAEIEGVPPLNFIGNNRKLFDYRIYGNSIQNGTPSAENPVDIQSVGDYNDTTGKYDIPITVTNGSNSNTVTVSLDEPLRKVGNYADYIDFANRKIVRNIFEYHPSGYESAQKRATGVNSWFQIHQSSSSNPYPYMLEEVGMSNFTTTVNTSTGTASEHLRITNSNKSYYFVLGFFINAVLYPDLTEFREWLSDNQIYVHMVMETPTEESITLPQIVTYNGNNTLSVGTSVQPSKVYLKY